MILCGFGVSLRGEGDSGGYAAFDAPYPHIECPDDDSEHPFGQAGSDRDDP